MQFRNRPEVLIPRHPLLICGANRTVWCAARLERGVMKDAIEPVHPRLTNPSHAPPITPRRMTFVDVGGLLGCQAHSCILQHCRASSNPN